MTKTMTTTTAKFQQQAPTPTSTQNIIPKRQHKPKINTIQATPQNKNKSLMLIIPEDVTIEQPFIHNKLNFIDIQRVAWKEKAARRRKASKKAKREREKQQQQEYYEIMKKIQGGSVPKYMEIVQQYDENKQVYNDNNKIIC